MKFIGRNFADTYIDLTHTHRFEEITDLPTTLQDYGITDALPLTGGTLTGNLNLGTNNINFAALNASAVLNYSKLEITGIGQVGQTAPKTVVSGGIITVNGNSVWHDGNAPNLSALADTEITSPLSSQVLTYTANGKWHNTTLSVSLNNLTNVLISNVENGQVLTYSSALTGWYNATPGGSSDIRLKDVLEYNVEPSVESVANAPSIRYMWNDSHIKTYLGSIAQYWQGILPDTVHEGIDGYLSMQYDVIALLSSISIAKRTIEHERRIEQLEGENARLRLELNTIKERVLGN